MSFDFGEGLVLDDLPVNTEDNDKSARVRAFRRTWIPAIKVLLSSAADIFGDWIFFLRTRATNGLDEFEKPLFFFCVVSSVLGFFTLVSTATRSKKLFMCTYGYQLGC
jgi:hypothetical protein